MRAPTPLSPPPRTERRRNLALAWAMVAGIFFVGACCGGVTTAAIFLFNLIS